MITLRNYRKNSELFLNRLSIRPRVDREGQVIHCPGVQRRAQNGPQHRASMAIIAADMGISDQRGLEVIGIARRQVQNCRQRLIDVAGRTQQPADHVQIGESVALDSFHLRCGGKAQPFDSSARQRREPGHGVLEQTGQQLAKGQRVAFKLRGAMGQPQLGQQGGCR